MIASQHKQLDWQRLLDRLGDDAPLLRAVLTVLEWLCPAMVRELPQWLWQALEDAERAAPASAGPRHADLLDRRSWFA